jgi:hypothetical protein
MAITPMLLLLIVPVQDKPKPDTPEDRARRAAIVDAIMAQPMMLRPRLEPPVDRDEPAALVRQLAAQAPARILIREGPATRVLSFEQPDPPAPDGELDPPEPVAPIRFDFNVAVLERENFDRWIFGDGTDEERRRIKLQSMLTEKIERATKDHDLKPAQVRKLRLAGSGDVKRFFDRVEEWRLEFEVARKNFNAGRLVLRDLEPLSTEFQNGPFGEDSFFAKTLKKIEDDAKAGR